MRMTAVLLATVLLCCAAPVAAQSVKIEFQGGKVDLSAQNATIRAILQEWGRQGGTRIVNGERVPGAPVTLELTGVYERDALEILLRGVAGYVVGPREASSKGASAFDRIMILPTSSAPRAGGPPGGQAFSPIPQQLRPPAPVDDLDEEPEPNPVQPVNRNGLAAPRLPPGVRQRVGQALEQAPGAAASPGARDRIQQIIEEDLNDVAPEEPRPTPTPQNPFGVAPGSLRPGVIAPAPPSSQRPAPREQQQ